MKIRFYVDLIAPYHLPKGQQINLFATTQPYQGKVVEGFRRYCFDVDFPPEAILEAIPTPASAASEIPETE